jgi:protocatechuate 3,4-dioxygenase beta subunit
MDTNHSLSRRRMLGAAGAAGIGVLATRTPISSLFGSDTADAASCASLTPVKTIGPYFVEEKLDRSNITTDPDTGAVVSGIPLALTLTLLDEDNGCAACSGAQVDIWHASPAGKYSDESSEGTSGTRYLRGYQVSDAAGVVHFTTVYPGWYSGRAVHIHVRIRKFDSSGNATYDFLSQLFFDDSLSDTVDATSQYSSRGTRDTRNAADNVYGSDGAMLILNMQADGSGGYTGTFSFGLSQSNQGGGSSSAGGGTAPTTGSTGSSGSSSSGSSSSSSGSSSTTSGTTADTSVSASLAAVSCTRGALGTRTLHARLKTKEAVSVEVKVLRGSKVVARRTIAKVPAGAHTLALPIGSSVHAGRATLSLTAKDTSANSKVLTKILQIPARSA